MRASLARELADRCAALRELGLDSAEAERCAFTEWLDMARPSQAELANLYEAFLEASEPQRRRSHGVWYTPLAVVHAQVRLVDDLLRERLGCAAGLADERVGIVDPTAGSGAYGLAILQHAGNVRARMRLFEAMPGAAAIGRALGLPIEECDALSSDPALDWPIVVCLGNPPYRRGTGDEAARARLDGFAAGAAGVHRKNLYNDYVYFWRWALRVALEARRGPAIVCLVTAASYLRGPAFVGMRQALRRALDDLWLIDLEGDYRAARATENVFPIRTPVAIALGARYGAVSNDEPARVHYTRLGGDRTQKTLALERVGSVADLIWSSVSSGWGDVFIAPHHRGYASWPRLTDLFPWQVSGAQLKRTWPIGTTPDVLCERWRRLLELPADERGRAFGPTRDRDISRSPPDLLEPHARLAALRDLSTNTPCIEPVRYAHRSFDRQWVLPDARLGDFMRGRLWRTWSPNQVFFTSMLTNVLGRGPAVVATALVPDLDHFRGSFGARAVIPLWCDAAGTVPNVSAEWPERLSQGYGFAVGAEALFAYCYALLGTRGYFERFEEELRTPGPRVPLTPDASLFLRCVELGRELLALHTYREVRIGTVSCASAIGVQYPTRFGFDAARQVLWVSDGWFEPVTQPAWDYSVSGYRVLRGWLRQRIGKTGRSPLDAIQPDTWTPTMTRELLELLWLVDATLALEHALNGVLDEVVASCR